MGNTWICHRFLNNPRTVLVIEFAHSFAKVNSAVFVDESVYSLPVLYILSPAVLVLVQLTIVLKIPCQFALAEMILAVKKTK